MWILRWDQISYIIHRLLHFVKQEVGFISSESLWFLASEGPQTSQWIGTLAALGCSGDPPDAKTEGISENELKV